MSAEAWDKILASLNHTVTDCYGSIPVYDGESWRIYRNSQTIYPGAENCADPDKVDVLRENVRTLLSGFPETIPQLEKLGVRVRALLNKPIQSTEEVEAWAQSVFNTGPISKRPVYAQDTMDLAYDDIMIEVVGGKDPVYVIPAAPRGQGVFATVNFSVPSSKTKYGPRHEYTKLAFAKQMPEVVLKVRYRGTTAPGEPQRPRGRPRKDGLMPGSPEAKEADLKKEEERLARQTARAAAGQKPPAQPVKPVTSVTELRRRRQRLHRKRDEQQAQTS